jgi:membrane-associated phospholipid phosphatase
MRVRASSTVALLVASALTGAAFAALTRGVTTHATAYNDGRARRRFPKRRRRLTKRAATMIGPLGKDWVQGPLALAATGYLWQRGAGDRAAIPALSAVTSIALTRTFERTLRPRRPPPGRHSPTEPSFPSGHSLQTAAIALTTAYVLGRERIAHPAAAIALGLLPPTISGLGRLYLDRHWTTDVVAGWLAGISVASACAALYEAMD